MTMDDKDVVADDPGKHVGGDIQAALEATHDIPASDLQQAPEPHVRDPATEPPVASNDDGDTGAPAG